MHMHMTASGGHERVVTDTHVHTALRQFRDASLPLVVDLGCGRGSFLLTLASRHPKRDAYNYLGVDRSPFLLARVSAMYSHMRNCFFKSEQHRVTESSLMKLLGKRHRDTCNV